MVKLSQSLTCHWQYKIQWTLHVFFVWVLDMYKFITCWPLKTNVRSNSHWLIFGEQIGQKSLTLGVKFKAKAIVEVTEEEPQDLHDGVLHDLHFDTVEGDFQVFKGTWWMHQVNPSLAFLLWCMYVSNQYRSIVCVWNVISWQLLTHPMNLSNTWEVD